MIPWPLIDERDNILTFQLKVWLLSKNRIKSVWILFINIVVVVVVAQDKMDRSQMVILVTFLIAGRLSDKPGIVRFVRSTMISISGFQSQREWWQPLDQRCCTGAMKRVYELPPIPHPLLEVKSMNHMPGIIIHSFLVLFFAHPLFMVCNKFFLYMIYNNSQSSWSPS